MPDLTHLPLFLLASAVLLLTPGPAVLYIMYALLAGTVGQWLKGSRSAVRAERYVVGGVYIGLGVTAAVAEVR